MQENYFKVKVAQDQAVAAWAKWVAANDSCREAYYTFMKAVGGEGEAYARYREECGKRDALYMEAMDAAANFWRKDCSV